MPLPLLRAVTSLWIVIIVGIVFSLVLMLWPLGLKRLVQLNSAIEAGVGMKPMRVMKMTNLCKQPLLLMPQGDPKATTVNAGDALICANFRPDRAREITRAFTEGD